ncbi:MAG: biosynthetic-type acetolactate synthase large subunit [Clostridiales bacterium]|nr:biosynthetic-type acetolactate synthase large subunit [Clostridiales bacterium]
MEISGTKLFLRALEAEGVEKIFAYPGGTVTDLFDELYRNGDIDIVLPRHEQALVHEAEGYARETGRTGVCLVTSGPGATNTVTAIADAFLDSIPLVVFTGQVALGLIGNEAFQEVDIVGITRHITKYSVTVRDRKNLGRIIKMAFQIASTGKPGPVLIDLPKDIQNAYGPSEYPDHVDIRGYKPNESVHVGQLRKATKLLKSAGRPVILAGGGVNIAGANEELARLSELTHIPVITTVMGKGAVPSDHPYYIGGSGLHGKYAANIAISQCNLLFSIGTRFNDRVTGELSEFAPKAKIIHLDIDAAAISRNVVVDVPIVANAKAALAQMVEWIETEWKEPKDTSDWMKQIKKWDAEHPLEMRRDKGMTPQMIMEGLNEVYPDEVTYVTDVGQHQMWASQFLHMNKNKKLITSGGLGTMGFGFPAALGAKMGHPDRPVVCITGDGGFQMNMQEMATAIIQELPVTICLLNNYYLGMVRQMQQLFYGKRYSATCLRRRKSCPSWCKGPNENCPPYVPDFIKWAESYGAHAMRVEREEDIVPALLEAKANTDAPTLIEFMIAAEELVLPMVPGGNPNTKMILE